MIRMFNLSQILNFPFCMILIKKQINQIWKMLSRINSKLAGFLLAGIKREKLTSLDQLTLERESERSTSFLFFKVFDFTLIIRSVYLRWNRVVPFFKITCFPKKGLFKYLFPCYELHTINVEKDDSNKYFSLLWRSCNFDVEFKC